MTHEVAVIGTGNPDRSDRYSMGYRHARGYKRLDDCDLVACVDIVESNAREFAEVFGVPDTGVYTDNEEMLSEASPDIVSVCTPPRTHADIVIGCAENSDVDAVHCEKPMAGTWGACRRMVDTCEQEGVQLTFNHQRRFAAPFRKAKTLLEDGRIGALRRVEVGGEDLYDIGTHIFDIAGYVTDQTPVEWVLGQVDCRDAEEKYGLYQETQAIARWRYESGVDGVASTGEAGVVPCHLRLVGHDGVIEAGHTTGPPLRLRVDGGGWADIDTGRDGTWRPQPHPLNRVAGRIPVGPDRVVDDPTYVERGIADVVSAVRDGERPELSGDNALQTTELIFACWESARLGRLVELPLEIDDNPLTGMVEETQQ